MGVFKFIEISRIQHLEMDVIEKVAFLVPEPY